MENFSKKVMDKIKEEHIVPDSRFRLLWKSYLFWFLMLVMISLGALFFSLILLSFSDFNPSLFPHLKFFRLVKVLIVTAPYLWIVLSLMALIFGLMAFRNTNRGYRPSALFVTSLLVLVVSILGVVGHMFKISNRMDRMLFDRAPHIRDMASRFGERWSRPGDGMIGGRVVRTDENDFFLENMRGENWRIHVDERTKFSRGTRIAPGEKVGVIGEKIDDFAMQAFLVHCFNFDRDFERRMRFPETAPMNNE